MNRRDPAFVGCAALASVAGAVIAAMVEWRDAMSRLVGFAGVAAAAIGAGVCWLGTFLARLEVDPSSIEAIASDEEDIA